MSNHIKPHGDPEGRRLARRQAALLAEAGTIARVLEVLLRRTNCEAKACSDLLKEISAQELITLQKSYGRIEPRSRLKTKTQRQVLWHRPRHVLYIDEGGKSGPERFVPPVPTYFALAGISMGKFGVKIFPDSDIRDRIDEHRVACGARFKN